MGLLKLLSSKRFGKKVYKLIIIIENRCVVHTTDNLFQIETQSWRIDLYINIANVVLFAKTSNDYITEFTSDLYSFLGNLTTNHSNKYVHIPLAYNLWVGERNI